MHVTDKLEKQIKEWASKRLEHISDAETDVLADYVVALCRTEGSIDAIKRNAIAELEDFLKDNTISFVNDLFAKFMPQSAPLPALTIPSPASISNMPFNPQALPFNPPIAPVRSGSIQMAPGPGQGVNTFDTSQQKRKRSYADREDHTNSSYGRGQRPMKVMRGGIGSPRTVHGYGNSDANQMNQNGFGRFSPATSMQSNQNGFGGFPRTTSLQYPMQLPTTSGVFPQQHPSSPALFSVPQHSPTSPFPFDPNDPMAAMMAMQAMGGFPQMPGIPQFPLSPSPIGAPPHGGHRHSNGRFPPRHRLKPPCKDYDTQGYCLLGDTCPYEHGTDHLVVPPKNDEYDPASAAIMVDVKSAPSAIDANPYTHGTSQSNSRGRGHGRGGRQPRGPSRADFSLIGPNDDRSITSIVVEQIPEESFAEEKIRDFFSQFGPVLEITLQPYKHLAIVKFDGYFSAKAAWKSPKPVFDNRFVKVYWLKPETETPDGGSSAVKHEGFPTLIKSEPDYNLEEFSRQQALAQEAHEEKLKKRLQTENLRQALEKQKEELRKRQDEEKAKLIAKLAEKGSGDMKLFKSEAETDVKPHTNGTNGIDTNDPARTQALRDQYAALQEEAKIWGIDPENPENPTEEPVTAFPPRGRGRGRGRGSYRGRGGYPSSGGYLGSTYDPSYRGGYHSGYGGGRGRGTVSSSVVRLDNRPKSVAVNGMEFDDAKGEALREFLLHLGPFTSIAPTDSAAPSASQTIAFADRFVAEKLYYGTRDIPGVGRVEFQWVADPVYVTAHGGVKTEGDVDVDGDTKMAVDTGEHGDDEREGREGGHDDMDGGQGANGVNYDVAYDSDGSIT